MSADLVQELQTCREAEKEQALFYRALAVRAEEQGDEKLSERFQQLHADEQHHLSRLTARLLELGAVPADLSHLVPPATALEDWDTIARRREGDEVSRYEQLVEREMDAATEALVRQILETERHHIEELGGKWMPA